MGKSNVDDYLQQGIYGKKEIKPDERRKFLGTIRERVVMALTAAQVREVNVYKEVVDSFKINPKAHLYLNGNMDFRYLSKYIKHAERNKLSYTLVTNKEYNSELGLVLAYDYAIDKDEIYITKKENTPSEKSSKGLFSIFKKAFKK
ncbi:YueI family protein [Ferdinandcohnia quinoae]|uniref:YueI family protein n=1 Tax=Fredinandcohnia quinoae TaxID=2918902 RepID=A0AAW5E2M2_9BACI|nr:YueI family protein [Fredinandcohnia sp. SECRCQ15]